MKKLLLVFLLNFSVIYSGNIFAEDMSSKVENLGQFRSLSVPEIKVREKNGFLQIQAKLLNKSIYDQDVYYRFKWIDEDGFEASEPDSWKKLTLIGKQTTSIVNLSPTTKAKDFKIEIQAPHNKSIINPF